MNIGNIQSALDQFKNRIMERNQKLDLVNNETRHALKSVKESIAWLQMQIELLDKLPHIEVRKDTLQPEKGFRYNITVGISVVSVYCDMKTIKIISDEDPNSTNATMKTIMDKTEHMPSVNYDDAQGSINAFRGWMDSIQNRIKNADELIETEVIRLIGEM